MIVRLWFKFYPRLGTYLYRLCRAIRKPYKLRGTPYEYELEAGLRLVLISRRYTPQWLDHIWLIHIETAVRSQSFSFYYDSQWQSATGFKLFTLSQSFSSCSPAPGIAPLPENLPVLFQLTKRNARLTTGKLPTQRKYANLWQSEASNERRLYNSGGTIQTKLLR